MHSAQETGVLWLYRTLFKTDSWKQSHKEFSQNPYQGFYQTKLTVKKRLPNLNGSPFCWPGHIIRQEEHQRKRYQREKCESLFLLKSYDYRRILNQALGLIEKPWGSQSDVWLLIDDLYLISRSDTKILPSPHELTNRKNAAHISCILRFRIIRIPKLLFLLRN